MHEVDKTRLCDASFPTGPFASPALGRTQSEHKSHMTHWLEPMTALSIRAIQNSNHCKTAANTLTRFCYGYSRHRGKISLTELSHQCFFCKDSLKPLLPHVSVFMFSAATHNEDVQGTRVIVLWLVPLDLASCFFSEQRQKKRRKRVLMAGILTA